MEKVAAQRADITPALKPLSQKPDLMNPQVETIGQIFNGGRFALQFFHQLDGNGVEVGHRMFQDSQEELHF